ncbi:hypothetical protein N9562_00410 [Flavobacteriaceae bacterium]|nr:hypothetical protein [Flavobacteriaceae bacterium]
MKRVTVKKDFLFNDEKGYNNAILEENNCIDAIERLTLLAESTIKEGCIEDYEAFLNDPMRYMIDVYWNVWGYKYNAPNSDKRRVYLTSSNINVSDVDNYTMKYKDSVSKLGANKPVLKGNKVERVITKESFDMFVTESKKAQYKASTDLIKAIKKFKDAFPNVSHEGFHISRFTKNIINYKLEVDSAKFVK